MNIQKVEMYLMINGKYFPAYQIARIKEQLINSDESLWERLETLELKDPATAIVTSLMGGTFGIDRFLLGDVGLGIGKLLTCGGFGIWTIVDWFMIQDAAKDKNYNALNMAMLWR